MNKQELFEEQMCKTEEILIRLQEVVDALGNELGYDSPTVAELNNIILWDGSERDATKPGLKDIRDFFAWACGRNTFPVFPIKKEFQNTRWDEL